MEGCIIVLLEQLLSKPFFEALVLLSSYLFGKELSSLLHYVKSDYMHHSK
jgi:hypothetical protein